MQLIESDLSLLVAALFANTISLFPLRSDLRDLANNLHRSKCKKTDEDLIALPRNGEILFSDAAGIILGER